MKRCIIFGGGQIVDQRYARNLIDTEKDYIICADSGYSHCCAMGIVPQLVVGDFDSYRGDVSKKCELIRVEAEKNDTDTMLAEKEALRRGYTEMILLGMTGGRMDHTLANIQTVVYAARAGARAVIMDRDLVVCAICGPDSITVAPKQRCTLSVFSHSDESHGVCIRGAKYPLEDATLTNTFPLGVSNAFLPGQTAQVSVEEGTLVILVNRDN